MGEHVNGIRADLVQHAGDLVGIIVERIRAGHRRVFSEPGHIRGDHFIKSGKKADLKRKSFFGCEITVQKEKRDPFPLYDGGQTRYECFQNFFSIIKASSVFR